MADVVISEFMDDAGASELAGDFDVSYDPSLFADPTRLFPLLADSRALIVRNRTQVNSELIAAPPALSVVGRLGVGLDNIDLDGCAERGIEVLTAEGANAQSVAEYVIGAILALLRPALRSSARVARGEWPRRESIGSELSGRNLGLVGLGVIARLVAAKAAALGMMVSAYDPVISSSDPGWDVAGRLELEPLLRRSDVVSLHVPLLDSTRHIIDEQALTIMKPSAVVVNASRGGIVDEDAVLEALRTGRLGGAALDVFENEPIGPDQAVRFTGVDNLILTPHIAGLTAEAQRRVGRLTADNVRAALGRS